MAKPRPRRARRPPCRSARRPSSRLIREARSRVGHRERGGSIAAVCPHGDVGALRRVAKGVVEQDTHDLGNALGVAVRVRTAIGQLRAEPAAVLGQRRGELAGDRARQLRQVDGLASQLDRAGVQARQVEQVDRELLQAGHLLAHRFDELVPRLVVEVLVLEQLHEAAEREDRRAQLVRCGGDEFLARRVQPAQPLLVSR